MVGTVVVIREHSTESADPMRSGRLPGLDGIRALAIIAVFVYHLYPGALPGGYLGVDLFFVLSGYLITRQLVTERDRTGRIGLGHFWSRRAYRILPALLPVLIAATLGLAATDPSRLRALRTDLLGAVSFGSNWFQIALHHSYFTRFSPPSVLQHLWSLAVEEQFYLLWPLLVVLILRRGRRTLAVAAAIAGLASAVLMATVFHPGADPSRVYFGTDTHCFGLLLGAVLAVAWPGVAPPDRATGRSLSMLGIGVVAAGLWWLDEYRSLTYRGGILVVCAATALLIVGAGHAHGPIGRVLGSRPARWVGARSYGLYLWHWPVLLIGDRIAGHRTPLVAAAEVFVAVSLAALSYRYLEQPVLRHGVRQVLAGLGRTVVRGYGTELTIAGVTVLGLLSLAVASLFRVPPPPDAGLQAQLANGRTAAHSPVSQRPPVAEPNPRSPVLPNPSPLTPSPSPSHTQAVTPSLGRQVTAVGDSVMLASAQSVTRVLPGISIDAVVSRYMLAAPQLLADKASSGELRRIVVLGLGTNGPFPRSLLERIVRTLGSQRELYLVNVWVPTQPWGPSVNRTLAAVAAAHASVHLVDWYSAIAHRQSLLWTDHVHPRPGAGTRIYATTLTQALTASHQDE
ncbi:MAG: acyltransferase family protein [Actinocatenispora sp.]